jgi:hypothetical protein
MPVHAARALPLLPNSSHTRGAFHHHPSGGPRRPLLAAGRAPSPAAAACDPRRHFHPVSLHRSIKDELRD